MGVHWWGKSDKPTVAYVDVPPPGVAVKFDAVKAKTTWDVIDICVRSFAWATVVACILAIVWLVYTGPAPTSGPSAGWSATLDDCAWVSSTKTSVSVSDIVKIRLESTDSATGLFEKEWLVCKTDSGHLVKVTFTRLDSLT